VRTAIVLSTGGSVVRRCLAVGEFRNLVDVIVSDRIGSAPELAREHGIPFLLIPHVDNLDFSNRLLDLSATREIDLILSFHTRLYVGRLLDDYAGRLVNFHPSLLPAFAGFRAFERALEHGSTVLGTTVHMISSELDMGAPILQTVIPNDPALSLADTRHRVFIHQCRSVIQVTLWFRDGRVKYQAGGRCLVSKADYSGPDFYPCLDSPVALALV